MSILSTVLFLHDMHSASRWATSFSRKYPKVKLLVCPQFTVYISYPVLVMAAMMFTPSILVAVVTWFFM